MAALSAERCQEIILAIATETQQTSAWTYQPKPATIDPALDPLSLAEKANLASAMLRWLKDPENRPAPATIGAFLDPLSLTEKADLANAMLRWLKDPKNRQAHPRVNMVCCGSFGVFETLRTLLSQPLPLDQDTIVEVLMAFCHNSGYINDEYIRLHTLPVVGVINRHLDTAEPSSQVRSLIEATCDLLTGQWQHHAAFEIRRRIGSEVVAVPLRVGEAWCDRAIAELGIMPQAEKIAWVALLLACWRSDGSKPNKTWWATVEPSIAQIGVEPLQQRLALWLSLVAQPRTSPVDPRYMNVMEGYSHSEGAKNDYAMYLINVAILKGLCWASSRYPSPEIVRGLAVVALGAFRKVPGVGPVCIRLGNAALWALGDIADVESTMQLARLKAKVKLPSAQKSIAKALTTTAKKAGVSLEELEELSVPDFGFTAVGQRREVLGDAVAELIVLGNQATLNWFTAEGKPQKSVPKAVKDSHGEVLKDLKQTLKDIQELLPAQRDRLEALYLARKTWPLSDWRERYLDHPLVGTLARRLIWQFETDGSTTSGIWHDGHLVTVTGDSLENLPQDAIVSLWHPIAAAPDTVLAWRTWLIEHQIQQPFKQAHREIYLLTAAEQQTHTYSNRFAAHIIKQPQYHALCNQRGWRDRLRMMNSYEYDPSVKLLPSWNLRVEFWVTGIGEDYAPDLTTDAGGYRYLSTDQVRFYPLDVANPAPLPLQDVPALAFSEVMRDVDLFVGVASVGNDPAWVDGGLEQHRDYWHTYSFGALSETAQTRRQVLETLVPRLALGDRCTFQDRFLVVRGDLRTYKIHLGSGNILMEPNDQYLCIVPDQRQPMGQVFLPFEGDSMTAIVLSKALLLAHDTKIKDPSILGQIKHNSGL